jgi:hypothetical protein
MQADTAVNIPRLDEEMINEVCAVILCAVILLRLKGRG